MERHLSLIKTDYQELEKRVFPRFPFGFMIFKEASGAKMVFEVKDISLTGMQLSFKDGTHDYKVGSKIEGELHWRGINVSIKARIQWVREASLGLAFDSSISFEEKMRSFLSFDNIVSHIKPLHKTDMSIDLPNNLMFWLKADGVLDLYVWEHASAGISRFQILMMEHFIEWEEGVGLKTGRVMTQRDLDTPLSLEDEFVFQIDDSVVAEKIEMALGVVRKVSDDHLPTDAKEFLIYKLGG
nr:PilZ domain-containing protein [Bacteriovorax sp. HI3]